MIGDARPLVQGRRRSEPARSIRLMVLGFIILLRKQIIGLLERGCFVDKILALFGSVADELGLGLLAQLARLVAKQLASSPRRGQARHSAHHSSALALRRICEARASADNRDIRSE